jgi:hypothetical protein
MNDRSKLPAYIFGGGLLLGILGDVLLRAGPWGANLPLWILALVAAVLFLAARYRVEGTPTLPWPAILAVLFAFGFAWRDAPGVKAFNFVAMIACFTIWVLQLEGARARTWSVLDYVRGIANSAAAAAAGALYLTKRDVRLAPAPQSTWLRYGRAAALGLLISFPLLAVFGGLLMAADAVFEQIVTDVFDFDIEEVLSHGVLTAFFAWMVWGFLLLMLRVRRPQLGELHVERPALGAIEVALPLVLINLLFLTFVVVQLRYLFGDASLVEETVGLTYSEYARRGFFELVIVVALVLPLLLAAEWVLAEADEKSKLTFRLLAGVQVLLLFVIMISAVKRMMLYQSVYGLTEQRFYATAFMAWLAIVLAWFAVSVLRGRRGAFATGAVIAGLFVVGAVNVVSPDAFIAELNTTRAFEGEEFDGLYAASLSGDAVPTLVAALPRLNPDDQCVVAARLLDRWNPTSETDWRTWNLGRARAWQAVERSTTQLTEWACDPTPTPVEEPEPSPVLDSVPVSDGPSR